MRSILSLALGIALLYPVTAASASGRSVTLRKECTRDRCVYYRGSTRVFSVEKEAGTTRLIIRDGDRKVKAKVRENDDGTLEVKKPYWEREDR